MSGATSGRASVELPPSTIAPGTRPVPPPTVTMTTATDPSGEACPGCGQADGVQLTSATPRVTAWTCTRVLTWATSVVNPHLYPAQLAAVVNELSRQRQILRQIIALANEHAALSDQQLRARLRAPAENAT